MKKIELFVPGRLCLFGEHSDWAGMHRVMNADIVPGQAIVCGTMQGIYATVWKDKNFVVESNLECYKSASFECELNVTKLKECAKQGGFFSYVAGVASYVCEHYQVEGLHIRVDKMDLPIKSGLSSSAAICVLVARAFNYMYNLHLNTQGEMNVAFFGEQRTPSRCGRLDQACAFGNTPVHMEFDGNLIEVSPIKAGGTFYWVFAELNGYKDTVKILADLNKCYPFAQNELESNVQRALGRDNELFVSRAKKYLESGDACSLGKLMIETQNNFDMMVAPASPRELSAPELHRVLNDSEIKQYVYGAKGVGSQGDGSVQFLAKDEENQKKLIEYLKQEYDMEGFALTISPQQKVKRAIIPVAGFGTRLYPQTRFVKKEFMPVVDREGLVKPVIMVLLEQLMDSGIEEICLVIGKEEQALYDNYFSPLEAQHVDKLSEEKQQYENQIVDIAKKIHYVYQNERKGFGHAVYQCREFTQDEPVLLLLGDMIYESYSNITCSKQLINAFDKCERTMLSMEPVPLNKVSSYGVMTGKWTDSTERVLQVSAIVEKPDMDYAKEKLGVTCSDGDTKYFSAFGQYILTKEVFEELEYNIKNEIMTKGEFQLTDALATVSQKQGIVGFVFNGKVYDVGTPDVYRKTVSEFGLT